MIILFVIALTVGIACRLFTKKVMTLPIWNDDVPDATDHPGLILGALGMIAVQLVEIACWLTLAFITVLYIYTLLFFGA